MKRRRELLVLGHVTRDEIGGEIRWGGAAAYAAMAAARLGVPTALVTAAPPHAPLLDELRAEANLRLHVVPSESFTTFSLDYSGPSRVLSMSARALSLRREDIPRAFARARTAYVGTVAGECSAGLVQALASRRHSFVGLGLQGWLRQTDEAGVVRPAVDEAIFRVAPVGAVVVSEHDHPDVAALAAHFVDAGAAVALTRGARGASLFQGDVRVDIAAEPATEVDPTGAGDVFGVFFTLHLARGASLLEAGRAAAAAAARVVEGPGLGTLGPSLRTVRQS